MSRRTDGDWAGSWGPRPPDPSIRVGDAERNQVAEALSQHFSAGRIDDTELKERLDRAMSAKTGADLAGLMDDLPPLTPQPQPPPPPRRGRGLVWVALAFLLLATVSAPWHAGAWPWWPRIPWVLFGVVAFLLWRRARRHRWHDQVRT
jgi:hypothetical protein